MVTPNDIRPPNFFAVTEGAGRPIGIRLANFGNDSDRPLKVHEDWIKEFFLPMMAKNPGARVRLIGMASRNGDANYNKALSGRRIANVEKLFNNKVRVIERSSRGEDAATEEFVKDGNRDSRWRAVLLMWEGLSGPQPPLPPPGPTPNKFKKVLIKTQPGVWLVTGVDTFGFPIKLGVTAGTATVTLLNDKGEQWAISGVGVGAGLGPDLGLDKLGKLKEKAIELLMKLGDLPNLPGFVVDGLPSTPSATTGGIFRNTNIKSGFTIEDFKKFNIMSIANGGLGVVAVSGEVGLILFGATPLLEIANGGPWGMYSAISTLKLAAEVGVVSYAITSIVMKGLLEKEVLDV